MAEPNCHYCDRAAEAECPTCGRLYCSEHGEDVCLRCLAPEAAAPTALAYRGAVLSLVVGSLVALFLVIRPPASEGDGDATRTLATPTASFLATATPTSPGAEGTGTPATSTAAATPSASPSTAAGNTHTVGPGDTLSGLAEQYGTTVEAILAANTGLTDNLQIGAILRIPPAQ
ncbi:MAG: LysM domain-containing protein [Dehalococcoidia bacterium]